MASRSKRPLGRGQVYSFALLPALLALFGAGDSVSGSRPAIRLAGVSAPAVRTKPRPVSPFAKPPGGPEVVAPVSPAAKPAAKPEATPKLVPRPGAPVPRALPPGAIPLGKPSTAPKPPAAPTHPGRPGGERELLHLNLRDQDPNATRDPRKSILEMELGDLMDPGKIRAPGAVDIHLDLGGIPLPGSVTSPPDPPALPDTEGPSAKPPTPPKEGLQPMILAPASSGPAIPIPGGKTTNWGADEADEEETGPVFYAGILGTIKDKITGAPVENVEISIPEVDLRALSSKDGLFMIRGVRVRAPTYEVLMEAPGYEKLFTTLKFPKKGKQRKEFLLKPLGW